MRCSISMAPDLSPERYSTSTEDRPLAITCCRASEVSLTSNSRKIDWSTIAKFEVAHQEQQDGLRSNRGRLMLDQHSHWISNRAREEQRDCHGWLKRERLSHVRVSWGAVEADVRSHERRRSPVLLK